MDDMEATGDLTLDACCIRDLEDQRKAAVYRAKLNAVDPTRGAVDVRKLVFMPATVRDAPTDAFLLVLALPERIRREEDVLEEPLMSHLYKRLVSWQHERPESHRWAVAYRNAGGPGWLKHEELRDEHLPALVVWSHGRRVSTMEKRVLEKSTWNDIVAKISALKDVRKGENEEEDGEDEAFKCRHPGCDRLFRHEHIKPLASRFAKESPKDSDDEDDDDDGDDDEQRLNRALNMMDED